MRCFGSRNVCVSDCGPSNTHLLVIVHSVSHVPYLPNGLSHHECTSNPRPKVTLFFLHVKTCQNLQKSIFLTIHFPWNTDKLLMIYDPPKIMLREISGISMNFQEFVFHVSNKDSGTSCLLRSGLFQTGLTACC